MNTSYMNADNYQDGNTFGVFQNIYQGTYQGSYELEYVKSSLHNVHSSSHTMRAQQAIGGTVSYHQRPNQIIHSKPKTSPQQQENTPSDIEFHDPFDSPVHTSSSVTQSALSMSLTRAYRVAFRPGQSPACLSLGSVESLEGGPTDNDAIKTSNDLSVHTPIQHQYPYQQQHGYQHQCPRQEPFPLYHATITNRKMSTQLLRPQAQRQIRPQPQSRPQSRPQATPSNRNIQAWQDQLLSWPKLDAAQRSSLLSNAIGNISGLLKQAGEEHLNPASAFSTSQPLSTAVPMQKHADVYGLNQTSRYDDDLAGPLWPDEIQSTVATNAATVTKMMPRRVTLQPSLQANPVKRSPSTNKRYRRKPIANRTSRSSGRSTKNLRTASAFSRTNKKVKPESTLLEMSLGPIGAIQAMPRSPWMGFYKNGEITQQAATHMRSLHKLDLRSIESKEQRQEFLQSKA